MAKWADYLISAVRYNEGETHIIMVRQHADTDNGVGIGENVARLTVVNNLKNNYTYKTIYTTDDGKWEKGEDVRIIKESGSEYITTDPNETKKDNLGKLPRF